MALSSTTKHLTSASTTALIIWVYFVVLGAASAFTGLTLDDSREPVVVSGHGNSTHQAPVNILPVTAPAPILSGTPGFDSAARYRPPIINFTYQGGLVSSNSQSTV